MRSRFECDVAVVGGGIVGLATAYKIAERRPTLTLCVLEKESTLAFHQTGHNSGVIHSGLYYKPGSVKARTCAEGRRELVEFARRYGIPFEICGKVIVATEERELPHMERIFRNAVDNGIKGVEKIDAQRIKEIEPACQGLAGLHVPCTGIIDFAKVATALADCVRAANSENQILTNREVVGLAIDGSRTVVTTPAGEVRTRLLVNCAGLNSDRLAKLGGVAPAVRIIPFRGDYYDLTPRAAAKIRALIYPVPDPRFPFLGIHYTRKIDGSVDCGPNAVFAFKREGYTKTAFSVRDTMSSLTYPGTWFLFARNMRYGIGEYVRAFSKRLFLRELRRFIPDIELDDIRPGKAGVRAQAVGCTGQPVDDFKIEVGRNAIHVLNAPSPAATACLAIGDRVCALVSDCLDSRC